MEPYGRPTVPDRPATDADRQLAVAALRESAGRGLIGMDELEVRLGAVVRAERVGELVTITWDLRSAVPVPPARRSFWRQAGFNAHAEVYGVTNAMLVGTWALTGHGFFWPFFPIMGWGIGLGFHGVLAANAARKQPNLPPGAVPPPRAAALSATRYVAVLFADVADSTRLNEALGDTAWNNLRVRHLQMVRACVSGHGGAEVSTQGDGLFARFETPGAAVGCAIEIQRRLEAQQTDTGFAPGVRVGVHAGEALEEEADLVGNVVNLAARVTAEAEPGQILVTEPVADRLGDRVVLDDCGLRTLKGVSRPRHLQSVRW